MSDVEEEEVVQEEEEEEEITDLISAIKKVQCRLRTRFKQQSADTEFLVNGLLHHEALNIYRIKLGPSTSVYFEISLCIHSRRKIWD